MKYRHILALSAACLALDAAAEDLATEITVERTIATDLPAASPLSSVFPVMPPVQSGSVKLSPTQYTATSDFNPLVSGNRMFETGRIVPQDTCRGYLWAGYFPVYNLGIAAGYRLIENETTGLGVAARFNGMRYNNSRTDNSSAVHGNTLGLAADFSHSFSESLHMQADASYMLSALGSPTVCDAAQKQTLNAADIRAAIAGRAAVDYTGAVRYSYFGASKDIITAAADVASAPLAPAADSRLQVDAAVAVPLSTPREHTFRVAVGADILHTTGTVWNNVFTPSAPEHGTSGIISLDPSLNFAFSHFDITVGVKLDVAFNSPGKAFRLAPDFKVSWAPSGMFAAYATVGGGERYITQRDYFEYSPFAAGAVASSMIHSPVDGRVGFNVRPTANFTIGLFGGYSAVSDVPMAAVLSPAGMGSVATFVPVNLSGWNCGFDAEYTIGRFGSLALAGRLYPHNYASGSLDAPDRASAVLNADVSIHPVERLNLRAGYELRACRRFYTLSATGTRSATDMHNLSNLSFGADYAISGAFTVFASLENLLNRHALVLPSVEQQPLHGLVGVQLRF